MAISTDYPTPVTVNGFSCRNCSDVAAAKRHIDPTHPSDGPYGIDAKHKVEARKMAHADVDGRETAFRLGGSLAGIGPSRDHGVQDPRPLRHAVDVRV